MGQLEILEIGRRGISRKLFAEIIDGRRIVREADKDRATETFYRNGLQAMRAFVEIIFHAACGKKGTVQIIGPTMIRAYQLGCGAMAGLANHRAAVAAAIVKSADRAFFIARDDDRPFAHHHGNVTARFW